MQNFYFKTALFPENQMVGILLWILFRHWLYCSVLLSLEKCDEKAHDLLFEFITWLSHSQCKENRNFFLQLSNFQGFNWMLIKWVVFNRSSSNVGANSIFWRQCIYRFWKWTQKTRLKKMGQTLTLTLKGRVNVLCWKHQLVRWAILCSALVSDW